MFPKKLSSSAMVPEKVIMSFERVCDALKSNDSRYLRSIHDQFSQKISSMRFLSSGEHLPLLNKSIFRDIGAELYIPNCLKKSKHATALRSEATGNCLYNSVSLSLVGDYSLTDELRIITSVELFLNFEFYFDHPFLKSALTKLSSSSMKNLLHMCVSFNSSDTTSSCEDLVKSEAIRNCHNKSWSSFLCILALSSVISSRIFSYYPDCGLEKYKFLFNGEIKPRNWFSKNVPEVNLLFCFQGTFFSTEFFKPNHFVPLILQDIGSKRKIDSSPNNQAKKVCVTNLTKAQSKNVWNEILDKKKVDTLPTKPKLSKKVSSSLPISAAYSFNSQSKIQLPISFQCVNSVTRNLTVPPINQVFESLSTSKIAPSSSSTSSSTVVSSTSSTVVSSISSTDISSTSSTAVSSTSSTVVSSTPSTVVSSASSTVIGVPQAYDIALYRKKVANMSELNSAVYDLIKNVFTPDEKFVFQKRNGRSFRLQWLKSFPWLCYSPSENGAYCLSCTLFGDSFPSDKSSKIKKLFSEPFTHWPNAYPAFKQHQESKLAGLHSLTYTNHLRLIIRTIIFYYYHINKNLFWFIIFNKY